MILGLDFGSKRIGVAVSDDSERVAVGTGIIRADAGNRIAQIETIVREKRIRTIVVGLPLAMNGHHTQQTARTLQFVALLDRTLSVPVVTYDERLTSTEAERFSHDRVDERSAILMLQSYLDRHYAQQTGGQR